MMNKSVIQTAAAPAAIGPYSQAVRSGSLLFVSGQIPLDPVSGQVVGPGIQEQTKQVLANLLAVLTAAGVDQSAVVKTTIFLQDMQDFQTVNELYGAVFKAPYPARATVAVAGLPKGVLVEIDCIAQV